MSRTVFNHQLYFNETQTQITGTLSGSQTTYTNAIHLTNISKFSLQLKFDAKPSHFALAQVTGTFKLQCSNDEFGFNLPSLGRTRIQTWTDVSNSSQALSGSGDGNTAVFNVSDASYQWVRGVWVNTIGSGSLTARVVGKEGSS